MTRKNILIIGTASLIVAGLYGYVYRDRFRASEIQVYHRSSAGRPVRSQKSATNKISAVGMVAFGLDQKYRLTDVKVVSIAELATNQHPQPLWHLVTDSNSVPVKGFVYGERIRGMHSLAKKAHPAPLETNVNYRLLIEAGRKKGHYDFKLSQNVSSETGEAPAP